MQRYKQLFEIPLPPARRVLGITAAMLQRLIAQRVIEVTVARNGRQKTNLQSIERAYDFVARTAGQKS